MMLLKIIQFFSQCTDILKRSWKSKGLSDESINPPSTTDNSLARSLNHVGTKTRLKFDGSCSKQDQITFTHEKTVNICIVSKINLRDHGCDNYSVLENFGWYS